MIDTSWGILVTKPWPDMSCVMLRLLLNHGVLVSNSLRTVKKKKKKKVGNPAYLKPSDHSSTDPRRRRGKVLD
jgi:hypothetical protein